jgi:hypothetical protein
MTSPRSRSSSSKRTKLEVEATHNDLDLEEAANQDDSEDSCSICLHSIANRTVIPKCSHEFCFECLLVWTGMFNYFCRLTLEKWLKRTLFTWRTISPVSSMFTSHRRVFDTLHQIAVRLSKALSNSLTDITTPFSSSSNECRSTDYPS